jgi:hypothetical protein
MSLAFIMLSDNKIYCKFLKNASRKAADTIPDEAITFFSSKHSGRTINFGSAQFLIEIVTGNLHGDKGWLARTGDNPAAICVANVELDISQLFGSPQYSTRIALLVIKVF